MHHTLTLVLVHPSRQTGAKELARALRKWGTARAEGTEDDDDCNSFVVLETDGNSHRTIQEIAGTFGVAKVSMAIECESQFTATSKAIAEVGRRTVMPGQSFFVKAHLLKRRDFAARDLEFAATGALAAELAGAASPARNEEGATTTITAYVGRTRAFVSLREYEGAGGALAGSLGRASCAITGPLSLASGIAACKAGFVLQELLLLYSGEGDLYRNAKLARSLAEKTGAKRQKITIAKATTAHAQDDESAKSAITMLQLDLAAARMMIMLSKTWSKNVILPLSLAVHPQWFIEMVMRVVHDAGKVPFAPLMFSERDAKEKGKYDDDDAKRVTRQEFVKLEKMLLGKPRRVSLEVGPDYLHDIIDSI